MAEGSGLGGQESRALTPVEKAKYERVRSEVAVKVIKNKKEPSSCEGYPDAQQCGRQRTRLTHETCFDHFDGLEKAKWR